MTDLIASDRAQSPSLLEISGKGVHCRVELMGLVVAVLVEKDQARSYRITDVVPAMKNRLFRSI